VFVGRTLFVNFDGISLLNLNKTHHHCYFTHAVERTLPGVRTQLFCGTHVAAEARKECRKEVPVVLTSSFCERGTSQQHSLASFNDRRH